MKAFLTATATLPVWLCLLAALWFFATAWYIQESQGVIRGLLKRLGTSVVDDEGRA